MTPTTDQALALDPAMAGGAGDRAGSTSVDVGSNATVAAQERLSPVARVIGGVIFAAAALFSVVMAQAPLIGTILGGVVLGGLGAAVFYDGGGLPHAVLLGAALVGFVLMLGAIVYARTTAARGDGQR